MAKEHLNVINVVTGGLQDQCGFKKDGKYFTTDDYKEIGSLHEWRKWEDKVTHGEWVKPIIKSSNNGWFSSYTIYHR